MSRSAADLRSRSPQRGRGYLVGILLSLAAVAPPVSGQGGAGPTASFELTRSTQHSLHRLQESWLQWVSSFYQDNPAKADEALRALDASARQVGMTRLVDFSLGAAALGLQSGRDGRFDRAQWALAAAETLDPGRPEIAFARAALAEEQGSYPTVIRETASGFGRLLSSTERTVFVANLTFWVLAVLLLAAALFVLVEVATKGSAVVADLHRALLRRMAPASAVLCVGLALLWPLALPGGPLWLLLYWSALLWGYESPSERWATLGVWLLAGLAPGAAAVEQQRVAVALSPPMRALANLSEGRLYGGLFADLQVLRGAIGSEPAVIELIADVNRTLGQWDEARMIYRRVLELEPQNVSVLLNLGAYHFRKADFAVANEYFLRAANMVPPVAGAFYDLSLSYSETYQFEESRKALTQAKEIDADLVDRWVRTPNPERVLTFNGGLARRDEIRQLLVDAWADGATGGASTPRRAPGWLSLAGAGLAAALAVALYFVRRKKGFGQPSSWLAWRSNPFSRWLRALFPALSQAELGEGGRVGLSVLVFSTVVMLPLLFSLGLVLPLGSSLAAGLPWVLFVLGLLLYVGLCLRSELGAKE
jgi:tetratricopeptide (TPR) repeat protein